MHKRGIRLPARKLLQKPGIYSSCLCLAIFCTNPVMVCGQENAILEEIVVVAQKRSERLQDVPLSVSVVTGEKISSSGSQRFQDLSSYIPNFSVQTDPIGDRINIRGIQSGNQAGFEQSVSTFVDSVYRGRGVQSRYAFLDVDMLEILRGPQGVLFGKNTVAGALNIRSARPTASFASEVALSYNPEFDEREITGFFSGPLSENLRARLAFLDRQMKEGWVHNSFYNQDMPDNDENDFRLTLEWDAGSDTGLTLRHEQGNWEVVGQPWIMLAAGPLAAFGFTGQKGYSSLMGNDSALAAAYTGTPAFLWGNSQPLNFGAAGFMDGDSSETSLSIEHQLPNGILLNLIAANSEYEFGRYVDADFGPLPVVRFDDSEDFDQQSIEFRITSPSGGPVEYLFGGYWLESDLIADGLTYFSDTSISTLLNGACAAGGGTVPVYSRVDLNGNGVPDPFDALLESVFTNAALGTTAGTASACSQVSMIGLLPGLEGVNRYSRLDQNSDLWAVFGQVSLDLTDDIKATFGLRYTEDTKKGVKIAHAADYASRNTAASGNPGVIAVSTVIGEFTPHMFPDLHRKEKSTSWTAKLQWDMNPETMLYVSAATGFKAGGFNTFYFGEIAGGGASADDVDFENEDVLSFELGAKMSLLNRQAELNLVAFHTEYDDLQASVFTGGTTFVVQNAAEATSQGIEIDGRWRVNENLLLQAAMGWVDFAYDKFPNQACTTAQFISFRETAWNGGMNPLAALANNATCSAAGVNNLSGKTSSNTPELVASFIAAYTWNVSNYEIATALDINWMDKQYRAPDLDPISVVNDYALVNAQVSFRPQNGNWELGLVGRNLTDQTRFSYTNDIPLFLGATVATMEPPRSWAFRGKLMF